MELQNPSLFGYCLKCLIVTLLFSLYLKSPTTKVNALSNETDRLALLSFQESISNDPHGVLKSWNDSVHFCSWYGITCNTKHHRVTTLNLNSSKLRGTLTPYIGNLTFLKFINLRNNSFFGEIPEQVGHLIRLQHLNLSDNSFVSNVPMNLSYCSQLRIINLKSNGLVGNIPSGLGSLVKLVLLYLDLNNLTGTIPPSLGNITSLRQFSIKYNNLVGRVPQELGQLKNLSYLGLGPNKFSGIVPHSLFNMSSMTTFVLTDNQLYGTLPSSIGFTLPNIQSFAIAGNSFSGLIPESFSNASLLQLLDIQENNFYGHVPTSFGALQNLQILGLSRNGLGNYSDHDLDFITSLTNCSNLETLDLSFNKHGGVLPNSVANLSTKLSELYLGVNHISGKIPETLGNFINLYVLGMQYNQFTGEIPTSFGKLYKMQVLDLLGNRISGSIPFNIGNLTRLSELYLSDNQFEGNIPTSIANCENLQLMDMSQNKLSGTIPKEVIGLSTLSLALNLSLNNLSGSLPMEVGKLRSIKALDVSGNNLDGEIPETIGDCQNIEVLFLQQNIFVGNLPQTLVSLSGLQCLDISQNNLSGQIPKDLQKLHFLTYLNLSFNNFEGEVPYEGVFRNASIVSVVGNPKLCGSIPELLLPSCSIKLEKHGKKGGKRLTIIITLVVASFLLFMSFVVIVRQWLKKSKKKVPYATSDLDSLPKVSYRKLQQITDGFSPSKLIGKGSFGSVYQATLDHNDIVAIKVLNLLQKGASKSFIAECNALRNIRHRNLVKVLTCCSSMDFSGNEFKAIVFEYLSNGSLENWLHPVVHNADQSRCLNLVQRLNIIIDVASAMNYLHDHCEPPIVHCDLKPSNVLLDNDMVAHVSDFGLARLITKTDCSHNQSSTVGIKGTIGYAAPEYAMGCEPSKKGDVYSFGILVLEILTEKTPTDEMFKDGLNLRKYVEMEFPERLVQIVDPALLTKEVQEMVLTQENENHSDIAIEETNESANSTKIDVNAKKCLLSMLKIGLACSVEIQNDRMIMEDVNRELHHIRDAFINSVGILSES